MAANAPTVHGAARARAARGAITAAGEARRSGLSAARVGYGAAALAVAGGWLITRRVPLVDPVDGLGYWLGIVGASLMAILLLYPLRKRIRLFRVFGATRHWFRMHMVFGVLGPILILYHSNFSLGSLNSNVALVCTLLVAASGLVGRYLHARVYADLEGHKQSVASLSQKAALTTEQRSRASRLAPHLLERMSRFDRLVLTPPEGLLAGLLLPVRLAVTARVGFLQLAWHARREIRREAKRAGLGRHQRRRVQKAVTRMIATHLRRVRRAAEFHSYERLFSLWHVFHLPFFYILVVTALLHVLAVHMY